MNTRVEFIELEKKYDEKGYEIEVINSLYNCWADVKVVSFKDIVNNNDVFSKQTISVKVRKARILQEIDETFYIQYKDRLYEIIYVDDISDKNYYFYKAKLVR